MRWMSRPEATGSWRASLPALKYSLLGAIFPLYGESNRIPRELTRGKSASINAEGGRLGSIKANCVRTQRILFFCASLLKSLRCVSSQGWMDISTG